MRATATVTVMEEKMKRDAIIRNATTKRRINWKRVVWCVAGLLSIIAGIVLMICNITHTVPAQWGDNGVTDALIFFIQYGLLMGALFILMGGAMIAEEIGDFECSQRRRRRRRRTR